MDHIALTKTLDGLSGTIPGRLFGVERQAYIGDLIEGQSEDLQRVLREAVDELLIQMTRVEASDIDLGGSGAAGRVWYRVHGVKCPNPDIGPFTLDQTDLLLQNILLERQRELLLKNRNLDFSYTTQLNGNTVRLRADIYFDLDHLALNMRLIASEIRPFKGLGLHPNVARSLSHMHVKQGLTLVTGITGSGKSSTLDSIIDANNRSVDAHMIIIGAPIETVHTSERCIIRHREVGRDVLSFKDGATQALRQDPDIIVIGEMRDPDTILTGLEITDSGHRVFSTLHTASAVESIDRIIGECPPVEQERVRMRLADVLVSVMSQKLVPTLDGKRALAKEVMMATSSVKAAIRNNNTSEIYQMINEGGEEGMVTMEQDLRRLYRERRISQNEALNYANNKKRMLQLLEAV